MFSKNREKIDKTEQIIAGLIIITMNLETELKHVRAERKKIKTIVDRLENLLDNDEIRQTYV